MAAVSMTQDIFARSHAGNRAKTERAERDSLSTTAKQEIQARVKAEQTRREALAKPEPRYRPKFPMFEA
jgi:hypothetical protein